MTVPATTAEWICTRCGATNRKLVALGTTQITDRCVTCHSEHIVEVDERPVRWNARIDE
jgi:DNA-directed RNA polymerase subunit RPC12/RpoP